MIFLHDFQILDVAFNVIESLDKEIKSNGFD